METVCVLSNVIYASVPQLIISKNQSKGIHNLAYHVIRNLRIPTFIHFSHLPGSLLFTTLSFQ